MIHRLLVLTAIALCGLVAASFVLFAREQLAGASAHQQRELVTSTQTPLLAPPPHVEAQPRRFIDGAASTLTSPFASIVPSDSEWIKRGVPTLLALLVYGVGVGFVARYSRGMG